MTGKSRPINPERVQELLDMFNDSVSIARSFGMKLSFTEAGNAVIDLPYNPNLNHGRGGIHGGVYATLLDSAGALTTAVHHQYLRQN
jgi:acyl-coenzyme A thioesterase PaaI-like protein